MDSIIVKVEVSSWTLLTMGDIVVDPADEALVRLRFNLLADDVGPEFDNFINGCGVELTLNGEECGDRRTTYEDYSSPVILEFVAAAEGIVYAFTDIMVTRGNGYSYAFLGGGSWRFCSDIKHYTVLGASDAGFNSNYTRLDKKEIGPKNIMHSLYSLSSSSSSSSWENAFLYLCYVFIESVRLIEFGDFVRETLVNGAGLEGAFVHTQLVPGHIIKQPNSWGQACNALRGFFLTEPLRTHWNVSETLKNVFGSTPEYERERAVAAAIEDEEERKRAIILAEVNLFQSRVRIVMHR